MKRLLWLLLGLLCFSCEKTQDNLVYDSSFIRSREIVCGQPKAVKAGFFTVSDKKAVPVKIDHPRYLEAGKNYGLERILPNDNRIPAGRMVEDTLNLDFEVKWGDFRMETPERPGLKMVAIGEKGKAPTIPSPLVRIKTGTLIRATVHNTLRDSTITIFGFQKRPYTKRDSLFMAPGESRQVIFEAGEAGTYLYWIQLGKGTGADPFGPEEEQLSGAFIIDPLEETPPDRIFVMNVFSNNAVQNDGKDLWLESLTINGRSWPFTEQIKTEVGKVHRWRVINASKRVHPMHLHGFYFDVLERGKPHKSKFFDKDQIPMVVTETMKGRSTMTMQWEVKRPGNWLFHCHLSFHVTSALRLPEADNFDPEGSHQHMAGLVLGIKVKDGDTDLISKGPDKSFHLYATESNDQFKTYKFTNENKDTAFTPGDLLLLKQYQTSHVTVTNNMATSTSVHWHGLEIDSWSDGVPEWSSSEGLTSPVIEPGDSFTYKLSTMRAGTFVYHSHLDDVNQLTKGLYGPMIVVGENEVYHPELDHVYTMGWKNPNPQGEKDLDLNGWKKVPVQHASLGETHRLRLINIAPAGAGWVRMTKDDKIVPLQAIAKDGADLPLSQQHQVEVSPRLFVGETADYSFTPTEPGIYNLKVNYLMAVWNQTWIVSEQ